MKKKSIFLIISFTILTFLSFYLDNFIVKSIFLFRNYLLDEFFLGITFVSSEIIIFFVLTTMFLYREHKRKWIMPLWVTLFSATAISFILKILVQRKRPFQLNLVPILSALQSTSYSIWNFSFPSFQSMLVFCAVPILSKEFPKTKNIWILFAFLVAFSRVYFGVHFFSDVLIGGIIGYLVGTLIIKLEEKYNFGERSYNSLKNFQFSKK